MKGNKSILILERNHQLKFLYKEELADEAYITVFADDDRDAWQKIRECSPDLFITNYEISSTGSFTAMLHQTSKKEHIPIIINTAYPLEIIDTASFEGTKCITKTADLKILKKKIDVLLNSCNA